MMIRSDDEMIDGSATLDVTDTGPDAARMRPG